MRQPGNYGCGRIGRSGVEVEGIDEGVLGDDGGPVEGGGLAAGFLDVAEEAMLTLYNERAELVDGQRILELGCGWGSLTLWMAEKFPNARITAVSNSAPQREFIQARCRERGFANVEVITCDVNLLKLPWVALERIERYFHITGFALVFLGIFMFRDVRTTSPASPKLREFKQLTFVLLAASLSWYIVMKQHAAVHHFVGKQSGLLIGWIVGPALLFYATRVQSDWRQGRIWLRVFHALLILYMTAMALTQQILVMWWEFGFRRLL
jgi:hypothetical protein